MKFIVCVSREDCGDLSTDGLALGRLYEVRASADGVEANTTAPAAPPARAIAGKAQGQD
ncbi:MAG: hypothetical protein IPH35_26015 [Rhodoferax sp.]|nr:hypothetical protein [Rhodoferax sp.]